MFLDMFLDLLLFSQPHFHSLFLSKNIKHYQNIKKLSVIIKLLLD